MSTLSLQTSSGTVDPGAPEPIQFMQRLMRGNWLRQTRIRLEHQWLKCAAWTMGVQNDNWESLWATTGRHEPSLKRSQHARSRFQSNKIKPMVARRMAQLISSPPGWECRPKSTDFRDKQAAELGQDMLNHFYAESDVYSSEMTAAWWAVVTGSAFARMTWSPTGGKPEELFFDPLSGQPLNSAEIPEQVKGPLRDAGYSRMMPTGEMVLKVFSPFNVVVPPVGDPKLRPWTMEAELVHVEELYDLYPNKHLEIEKASRREITKPTAADLWLANIPRIQGLLGPIAGYVYGIDEEDVIMVRRLFYRACSRYPQGRHIVEIAGMVLEDGPNPYTQFGITQSHIQFRYGIAGSGPYGVGLVEDLVFPQKAANDIRMARVDNMRLMSKPQWLNPVGTSGSGVTKFTNVPGAEIKYKPPFKPEPVKLDPVDVAGEQLNNMLTQDMQDSAFMQDVTQAKVPQGLRSGVAISMLQERDASGMTPTARLWDGSRKMVGDHALKILTKLWPDGKILRLYGDNQGGDVRVFRSGIIEDNVEVVMPTQHRAPRSRTQDLQNIMSGMEVGLLDTSDPAVRMEALRSLELGGGWEKINETMQAQRRRALKENEIFAELGPQGGGWPAVEPWDDHEIHLRVLNELRVSDRWESLDPEIRMVIDVHGSEHEKYRSEQMEQSLRQMELARGGPGAKGRPSPPAGT